MVLLSWWSWLLAGFLLLLVELITPGGFYFFFFGVGAIIVALLAALGMAGPAWLQWFLFAALSSAALLLFRKPLQNKIRDAPNRGIDTMIGETAISLGDIGVEQVGKAELRGSVWSARNTGESTITSGCRCRVERVEGLTLYIRG